MDSAIESDKNKALAKTHIDYLGNYLDKIHQISHKGVHAELSRIEAIKAVFHTYLMVADILEYLKKDVQKTTSKLNIHNASLDELESVLGISRNLAKEIIKLRVGRRVLDLSSLGTIKGISKKAISLAEKNLSFSPINF